MRGYAILMVCFLACLCECVCVFVCVYGKVSGSTPVSVMWQGLGGDVHAMWTSGRM